MSVAAWSLLWQIVVAATLVAFFGLVLYITRAALGDLRQMFHDLRQPAPPGDDVPPAH